MKNFIKEVWKYVLVLCIIMFSFLAFFRMAVVDGTSMYPTLNNNDILLLRRSNNIKQGDIVAIKSTKLNEDLCKRVIGVEGDHIVINEQGLFINDKFIYEDYINEQSWIYNTIDIVVPKSSVFVMGDNRNYSLDSRRLGCLKIDDIKGSLVLNFTEMTHINSKDYKILLILLWCVFIVSYIIEVIVKFIKKHTKPKQ